MAASSGALRQWQSLPFPARMALIFLATMAAIWLTRWLGGISVLVALLLWGVVVIGLLHASGRLAWLDRSASAARLLESFAPRFDIRAPAASAAAPPRAGEVRERASPPPAAVDLARFVGLDSVLVDVDELVATQAGRVRPLAPATLALLVGPRGTGKSSVALALAAKLHRAGARGSERITAIGPTDLPGLGGSYGPSDDVLRAVSERIQAALDGTLLIDDLDWLVAGAGGHASAELGPRLLAVARRYPGRLFVIGTGSAAAVGRLDPANRWLGQLNVRRIDFLSLDTAALKNIFAQLLAEKGLRLDAAADRAVQIQIEERRAQGGDKFDNAHAIRRLVDDVLHSHGRRMRGKLMLAEQTSIITAEDVRDASPSL